MAGNNMNMNIAIPGHMARMSSLPSIDEDNMNNRPAAPPAAPSHRRAVSVGMNPSKPRFSLKSVGSISTSASSSSSASVGVTSLDLLGNMMTAYRDRDPYEYYAVLDTLGQGSIGSVEKVVRRRRHHIIN
jgi:hypothetical protein